VPRADVEATIFSL